ncbi:MAG: hypothetical protein LHW58_02940, partial [Candidatus Cloacimonetes bacterium]|nr:hypothetical protein [Candidatus Cloacimonadota bacterium]MCB5254578.1 hypothetical protein [Candidatus Cloacimonadota bacterium]MCK9243558.1 hypothetical protein [Candidatus Cloacimonadota bacterium]
MSNRKLKFGIYLVFSMLLSLIGAESFDQYPMGCYSYLSNDIKPDNPFTHAERAEILSLLSGMGYNIALINNKDGDDTLADMLSMMKDNGLYAIISDLYHPYQGSPDDHYNRYNTNALTTSSYLRLEAEYSGSSDIDGGSKDSKWYCSHEEPGSNMARQGYVEPDPMYLVENSWKCSRGTTNPGFAYTDIRWRWLNTYHSSEGYEPYKRLGNEFCVYNEHDSLNLDNKYIRVRYKLRLDQFVESINSSTPLFSFTTMGYKPDSTSVNHQFMDYNSNLLYDHTTEYYYGDFAQAGSPGGYFDIEIKISYADLISAGLLSRLNWWKYKLENLNPRMYWHGNCDLYLDFIEIEDQIHYDLIHNDSTYTANINNRIDYLQSQHPSDMIKYMYSMDEPGLGQFHSYKTVQQYISQADPENPNIITAAYDYHYKKIEKAGSNDEGYLYYDHVKSFRESASPNTILPDMYPINPGVDFNSFTLQERIDDKVLRQYESSKRYSIDTSPSKPFIPIVQAFGQWNGAVWASWVLPPYETQKCLKYLPLCYGADGVIDYLAVSPIKTNSLGQLSGQYCSIIKANDNLITATNFTREAVIETNAKISVWGPIIKHKLEWMDAGCLGVASEPTGMLPETNLNSMGLASLQAEDPDGGLYNGYIQCGLYVKTSASDKPYFMLVNRRANYANTTDGLTSTTTPPSAYGTHYISANSQKARFVVNNTAHNGFGTYLALRDTYNDALVMAEADTIRVDIEAGEGKLLQMCSSLPASVTSDAEIKNTAYLSGPITIDNGAEVTIHNLTETTILPHSTILVKGNSILNLAGTVTIADSVSIIVEEGSSINFD